MIQLERGNEVGIPCDVKQGAFPEENLITIETISGPVSGFVNRDSILKLEGESGYIRGVVHDVTEDTVTVWIRGSFFTTTGLAYLPYEWATSHLESIS